MRVSDANFVETFLRGIRANREVQDRSLRELSDGKRVRLASSRHAGRPGEREIEDVRIEEVAVRLASAGTALDALATSASRVLGRSLFEFLV